MPRLPRRRFLLRHVYGQFHELPERGDRPGRRLESAGITGYFQGIFLSEEVGADKPQRAFFEACFASIPHFQKETALMVGDSLTSDIRGGKNAGIRTCWFAPQGQPARPDIRPDYRICALEELPALLETL